MSVGDSLTIVVRGEKNLEALRKNWNKDASGDIIYQLILRAIKSESEYNKDYQESLKKIAERTKGLIPEKKMEQKTTNSKSKPSKK